MNPPDFNSPLGGLPPHAGQVLQDLLTAAQSAFGQSLCSVTLFGSAAEGKLGATSDINLIFVLKRFVQEEVDPMREPLRVAHAAAQVSAMFVLRSELAAAAEAFAVKFSDIGRRHRVLWGEDVFAGLAVSREAKARRLRQMLLNLTLRLRERYALVSLREEQLALVIAESTGPLRAAAATLLELEEKPVASGEEALRVVTESLGTPAWKEALDRMALAHQTRSLPAGAGARTIFHLIRIGEALQERAERLRDL